MISNEEFSDYYDDLLIYLFHKPFKYYTSRDYLQFICCLLLQDRVRDAIIIFKIYEKKLLNKSIPHSDSINGSIQRDYIASYLDFYNEEYLIQHKNKKLKVARERAIKYNNYPITNWNNNFSEIIHSINSIDDNKDKLNVNNNNNDNLKNIENLECKTLKVDNIIENTPSLSMKIKDETIHIDYRNLSQCKICYYPIDFEMQFSVHPFILSESKDENNSNSNITYTMPKDTDLIELPDNKFSIDIPINKNYIHQHSIIEVQGGHDYFIRNRCIYQPSKLLIQINENHGILHVLKQNLDNKDNEEKSTFISAPGVYIKVYSKNKMGKVSFWKDGYTDLLGRFNYVTVSSNNDILDIEKFSILILYNNNMGEIKEVNPPKM